MGQNLNFLIFFAVLCFNVCNGAYESNPFLNPLGSSSTINPAVDYGPTISLQEQSTASTTSQSTIRSTTTTSATTNPVTKEPLFTIEPPGILSGNLDSKCLQPNGQFPSFACNRYVNCWEGKAIEQACPVGLFFNSKTGYCDYLANTDCGKRTLEAGSSDTNIFGYYTSANTNIGGEHHSELSLAPASAANSHLRSLCQNQRGIFQGSSCNKFVNCWDDNVAELECPAGTLFSVKGYCDFAENVNCGDSKGPVVQSIVEDTQRETSPTQFQPPSLSTSTEQQPYECPLEFGTFRDRNNCSRYYICAYSKVAAKHECPEGLSFSDILGLCDYSYRVDCSKEPQIFTKKSLEKSSTQSQPSSLLAVTEEQPYECPLEFGTFRDRNNCSRYYICAYSKVAAKHECPEELSFSDILGLCDYSYRVDCSKEPQIYTKKSPAFQASNQIGPQEDCGIDYGTIRDPQNCATYYVCANRKVVVTYVCPNGFSYNDDLGICDYSERVNCAKPPKISTIDKNTSAVLPHFEKGTMERIKSCTPGTVFPLNAQCSSACICRAGMAEIVQCEAGLAYDPNSNKCVPANLVKC